MVKLLDVKLLDVKLLESRKTMVKLLDGETQLSPLHALSPFYIL